MTPADTERAIAAHLQAQAYDQAAALTLRSYSDELLGYLQGFLRDPECAREVFSMFVEDMWRSVPGLSLHTTMRAYCYALTRNAARRYLQRDLRKQRRGSPLHEVASQLAARERSVTAPHLKSENKQRVAMLRERLADDERELLTLRIDRDLSWDEVAEALGEQGPDKHAAVARCRKRFQLIKQKLTRWAREEGIGSTNQD